MAGAVKLMEKIMERGRGSAAQRGGRGGVIPQKNFFLQICSKLQPLEKNLPIIFYPEESE